MVRPGRAAAQATTDAPIFDDDFKRITASNGSDRAAHHAIRVEARPARTGDQELVEPEPFADQAGHARVGVGARLRALVATCAFLEVEDQERPSVEEPLDEKFVERIGRAPAGLALVLVLVLGESRDGRLDK